jgi:hypothetical protein
MKHMAKHALYLLVLLCLSIFGTKALFHSGLYSAHDIWHQVARLYHYTQALRDGQFPPSWISQLGHGLGYPLFTFSYHLPWMIGAPLALMGMSVENTIKLLFFLSFLASGLSMYWVVNLMLKNRLSAFAAASTYMWAPYRFLTIFVSASIGTAFQFVFIPLMFTGVYLIITKRPKLGTLLLSSSIALSILSHLMSFVFIAPFVLLFSLLGMVFLRPSRPLVRIFTLFLSLLVGVLLSSFYLLPAFIYSKNIIASNMSGGFGDIFDSNFVNLSQIIYSKWGYGPIVSNAKDGEISFALGIVQWLAVLATTLLVIFNKFIRKFFRQLIDSNHFKISSISLIVFYASILGMLSESKPVWNIFTKYFTLDYPFRLLAISVFFGSLLVGVLIGSVKILWMKIVLSMGLIFVMIFTNRNHINVNMYTDFPVSLYVDSETTTNTFHEYLPLKADASLLNVEKIPIVIKPENLEATNVIETTSSTTFGVSWDKDTELTIGSFDFPGQQLYIDNSITKHRSNDQGLITFKLPAGSHTVTRVYEQTGVQQTGKILTVIGVIILSRLLITTKKTV